MKKIINTFISVLITFLFWYLLLIIIINKNTMKFSSAFLSIYFIFGWIIIILALYYSSKKYTKENKWLHSLLNKLMAFALSAILWSLSIQFILLVDDSNTIVLFISPIIVFGWVIYFVMAIILHKYIIKRN